MSADELSELPIEPGRAFHRGDVIFIRSTVPLTKNLRESLIEQLAPIKEKHGINFVLLDHTLEVVENTNTPRS